MTKSDSVFKIFNDRAEFDEWINGIDSSIVTGLKDDIEFPIMVEMPISDLRVFPANELHVIAILVAKYFSGLQDVVKYFSGLKDEKPVPEETDVDTN